MWFSDDGETGASRGKEKAHESGDSWACDPHPTSTSIGITWRRQPRQADRLCRDCLSRIRLWGRNGRAVRMRHGAAPGIGGRPGRIRRRLKVLGGERFGGVGGPPEIPRGDLGRRLHRRPVFPARTPEKAAADWVIFGGQARMRERNQNAGGQYQYSCRHDSGSFPYSSCDAPPRPVPNGNLHSLPMKGFRANRSAPVFAKIRPAFRASSAETLQADSARNGPANIFRIQTTPDFSLTNPNPSIYDEGRHIPPIARLMLPRRRVRQALL